MLIQALATLPCPSHMRPIVYKLPYVSNHGPRLISSGMCIASCDTLHGALCPVTRRQLCAHQCRVDSNPTALTKSRLLDLTRRRAIKCTGSRRFNQNDQRMSSFVLQQASLMLEAAEQTAAVTCTRCRQHWEASQQSDAAFEFGSAMHARVLLL